MNMLFRSVRESDLDAIYSIALGCQIGITTLPKNKRILETRIAKAVESFSKVLKTPHDEYYLFVLEDLDKNQIVGTAAIESLTGHETPFYSYRRIKEIRAHEPLGITVKHEYLSLTYDNEGKSEVCTLYLTPDYRHSGNGLLLSLARFLFIYHFPERFKNSIIAELRGVAEGGESPFWQAVGQHFFKMPFKDADERTLTTNKQFIADLLPTHPIYVNLLPDDAQAVIGVPDKISQPAMNILTQQGFISNDTVDIFDAGPTLEAQRENIRIIQNAQQFTIQITQNHEYPIQRMILSNASLSFKATLGVVSLDLKRQICFVTDAIARILHLKNGDFITTTII